MYCKRTEERERVVGMKFVCRNMLKLNVVTVHNMHDIHSHHCNVVFANRGKGVNSLTVAQSKSSLCSKETNKFNIFYTCFTATPPTL